jgi:hypothetical protein
MRFELAINGGREPFSMRMRRAARSISGANSSACPLP